MFHTIINDRPFNCKIEQIKNKIRKLQNYADECSIHLINLRKYTIMARVNWGNKFRNKKKIKMGDSLSFVK